MTEWLEIVLKDKTSFAVAEPETREFVGTVFVVVRRGHYEYVIPREEIKYIRGYLTNDKKENLDDTKNLENTLEEFMRFYEIPFNDAIPFCKERKGTKECERCTKCRIEAFIKKKKEEVDTE